MGEGSSGQRFPALAVGKECEDSGRQRRGVARRHEETGPSAIEDLRRARGLGGDDRHLRRHRLDEHDPERFAVRREEKEVEPWQESRNILAMTEELHRLVHAQLGRQSAKHSLLARLTNTLSTHQDEARGRPLPSDRHQRRNRFSLSLLDIEPPYQAEDRRLVAGAQKCAGPRASLQALVAGRKGIEYNSVGNDHDLFGLEWKPLQHDLPRNLGEGDRAVQPMVEPAMKQIPLVRPAEEHPAGPQAPRGMRKPQNRLFEQPEIGAAVSVEHIDLFFAHEGANLSRRPRRPIVTGLDPQGGHSGVGERPLERRPATAKGERTDSGSPKGCGMAGRRPFKPTPRLGEAALNGG
jgi:hypothetical protein